MTGKSVIKVEDSQFYQFLSLFSKYNSENLAIQQITNEDFISETSMRTMEESIAQL